MVLLKKNIRQFSAGMLLLVFAFAITPKKFLHDWFAGHTDQRKVTNTANALIAKTGFNCNIEDQVSESNFIAFPHVEFTGPAIIVGPIQVVDISFSSAEKHFSLLRGPPVLNC